MKYLHQIFENNNNKKDQIDKHEISISTHHCLNDYSEVFWACLVQYLIVVHKISIEIQKQSHKMYITHACQVVA